MSKKILALLSATLIMCSSIEYVGIKDSVFKGKIILEKQVSIGKVKGYDVFNNKYKENLERIEEEKRKQLEEHKKREQEEQNKIKKLDRGYNGIYRIINVNCIVSFYTNRDNRLEGGNKDVKGNLLVGHDMNVCATPSNIPYGSFIELDNMGLYKVVDTGGAIKWIDNDTMKIDIFIPYATIKELNNLGIKKVKGKIYIKE